MVKDPPAIVGDMGSVPGLGADLLEEGMATCLPCILAQEISGTEEPSGLQSMGLQRVETQLSDWVSTHNHSKRDRDGQEKNAELRKTEKTHITWIILCKLISNPSQPGTLPTATCVTDDIVTSAPFQAQKMSWFGW